jgi:Na+-transporting NADH:ubiquinone oxidoreductase subunit NqrC
LVICIVNYFTLLLLSGLFIIIATPGLEPAQAHVFSSDKTASLLAIANQLRSELKLIDINLLIQKW